MDGQLTRTAFQGVGNIVRFNWHFFVFSAVGVVGLLVTVRYVPGWLGTYLLLAAGTVTSTTAVSLVVSHYVYDRSGLYSLGWLDNLLPGTLPPGATFANINAGFDETSALLAQRYPKATLRVFDFYDPVRHTEVSIERARRAYPPYPGTLPITTDHVPVPTATADVVLLILAAHEIRDDAERTRFFRELSRTLKPTGQIVVVEHLRDVPNFLAYTIGFLHFHSRRTWLRTFAGAELMIVNEQKITPFITAFSLQPNGAKS